MEKFEIEQLKCVDTDPTLSANSDKKIPTQKAVKTLVENNRLQFIISLTGDSGALTQEQLFYQLNDKINSII